MEVSLNSRALAQWKVHSSCTEQTKATASLVIVLVSRIQISGPGENNFVKWKGTFRSDQQIRSVSVKGSHSQGADNYSMREGRLGSMIFFLSAGRVTLLQETDFLHIKGIKLNFRIRNCNREE